MFTDGDDLVNRNISAWVSANKGVVGWYSASELFYVYGGHWLREYSLPQTHSGPCAIFRSDLLQFDKPPFKGRWVQILTSSGESRYLKVLASRGQKVNTVAAVGHTQYRSLFTAEGHILAPLPFLANVVINHSDSTSHVAGGSGSRIIEDTPRRLRWRTTISAIKQRFRLLPSLRPFTSSLCRDFSILSPSQVPAVYRSRGLLFV
jgi:hypothetical protein